MGSRVAPLLDEEASGFRRLNAEDRRVAESALFYVAYHRYVPELDALIERQAKGCASLPVPFAEEAIAALKDWDTPEVRAARIFSFFFQLRRAF